MRGPGPFTPAESKVFHIVVQGSQFDGNLFMETMPTCPVCQSPIRGDCVNDAGVLKHARCAGVEPEEE